jgi:PAS domain-containing protein
MRTGELDEVNDFVESMLLSQRGGLVIIDRDLRISVWNDQSAELWGLRPDEAPGQHFLNLDIGLPGRGAPATDPVDSHRRGRQRVGRAGRHQPPGQGVPLPGGAHAARQSPAGDPRGDADDGRGDLNTVTEADREAILRASADVQAVTTALRSTLSDVRGEARRQRARSIRLRADARLVREHRRR